MSDYDPEKVFELQSEAYFLPEGEMKLRLLEEAANMAETGRDVDLLFHIKMNVVSAAVMGGHLEKGMPAFAWCLAQYQADPERFSHSEFDILWNFKNILHSVDEFPQLALDQVEALRDQMAALYRASGFNMRPVHYTKLIFAMRAGDFAQAADSFADYQAAGRDPMADCLACEADSDAEYFMLIGENEQALKAGAKPLSGTLKCEEVPNRTLNNMLRPLALLGRYEEADRYQKKGYRLIKSNPVFLGHVGLQIAYLNHSEQETTALKMFETHLPVALDTFQLRSRCFFYYAAKHLLERLAKQDAALKLILPQAFPLYQESGEYEVAALIAWLDDQLQPVAAQFDQRNGNQYHSRELAELLQY
ncbi:hypothetical protein [Blastopirellula marina]|uniref:Uncharacterized protein n=1 Tax=Blastopirellula marina TaxID=124 RepID=A0A2S8G6C6_9BACT|nr:hypothetical protein [Blastopirellula marina]PQO39977.1 hypothetical protein C5Y98_06565 [Blastopirellula marina]PTL45352.1 hypothetical protein C5Y97_06565 [Blastopirellula marina]